MATGERDKLNHLEYLWEMYTLSNSPLYLAEYLELGGTFDNSIRQDVCRFLRDGPRSNKGGRDAIRDVKIYMAIEEIRFSKAVEIIFMKSSKGSGSSKLGRMTLKEARRIYIEGQKKSAEDDTIRKQYERGRRILGREKGK